MPNDMRAMKNAVVRMNCMMSEVFGMRVLGVRIDAERGLRVDGENGQNEWAFIDFRAGCGDDLEGESEQECKGCEGRTE